MSMIWSVVGTEMSLTEVDQLLLFPLGSLFQREHMRSRFEKGYEITCAGLDLSTSHVMERRLARQRLVFMVLG